LRRFISFITSSPERLAGWARPIAGSDSGKQRRDDENHAIILTNLVFSLIVFICFRCEIQNGIKAGTAKYFYILEGITVFVCFINVHFPRTAPAFIIRLFDQGYVPPSSPSSGFSIPIGMIAIVNAIAIGVVTYYTGGPSASPYAQVLIAMLLIAEQTRLPRNPHDGKLLHILCQSAKEFRPFLVVASLFYLPLGYLQWKYPISVSTAPAGVTIGITTLIFLVGTVANYINRSKTRGAPTS
jgi:hypothetical protein